MVWVGEALREYSFGHDFASMSWSKQAAFDRGSFATLLGVEWDAEHNAVDVLAVGDSIALLVSAGTMVESWPFSNPDQFREHPTLLATIAEYNTFVGESGFWTTSGVTFHLGAIAEPRLLCMTDALGEWALRQVLSGGDGLVTLLRL